MCALCTLSLSCLCWWQEPKRWVNAAWYNICRYLSLLCQAATHGRTRLHAVAERLSISFGDNNWVCSPVSETPWLEPSWRNVPVSNIRQWSVRQKCYDCSQHTACLTVSWAYDVGLLSITIDDWRWSRSPSFQKREFFSLPPFVSRSSIHFSQLISQIVQKRSKSGLLSEHSEVFTSKHIVWTDSILIEPNQRKKYKLASLST